jgi:hypothetical protein
VQSPPLATGAGRSPLATAAGRSQPASAPAASAVSAASAARRLAIICPSFPGPRQLPRKLYGNRAPDRWRRECARRLRTDRIVANAVNPGGVATGLQWHFTQKQQDYLAEAEAAGVFSYKTVQQGAATTLVAAVAPEFAHTGGHYLDDGREAYTVPDDAELFQNSHGVKQWAIDPGTAQQLWTISLDLIGQPATL